MAPAAAGRVARLGRSLLRPGRGQVIAAVILCVVGMAGVMQIRSNATDDAFANARREDLIQLLDGLGAESRRLESEVAELRADQGPAAVRRRHPAGRPARRPQHRVDGAVDPGRHGAGRGSRDPDADRRPEIARSTPTVLLDAVEEMRDAGAEVIEVNDTVRVVGSTWFGTDGDRARVDGKPVSRPITLEVIGDPHSLEEAARFRGGIVSEITGPRIGGQVQIDRGQPVVIDVLARATGQSVRSPRTRHRAPPR